MYDLELLRKFCVLAKVENYTKASNELYISQPALSKSIQKLEEQMGINLFERTGRNIKLTTKGKIIYDAINSKMDYLCNIEPLITSSLEIKKNLRIGANSSIIREILTPVLKRDISKYDSVNIVIENNSTNNLISLLQEKKLDIIIINLPSDNIQGLDIIKLKKVQDVFIANEKFAYYRNKKVDLPQLQLLPIITYQRGSVVREHFQNYCSKNNVLITPHIEVTRSSLITSFCSLGLGIGFTTYEFIKDELEKNGLFILDVTPEIPSREIGILTRNEPRHELLNLLIESLLNFQL